MLKRHGNAAWDEELLQACRRGDAVCFSLLWDRHRAAGLLAARSIAPSLDAEDLVSDAYLRIFELVCEGEGPQGAFRPYMYRVIGSAAVARASSPEQASADLGDADLWEAGFREERTQENGALDLDAVADAFATLSSRRQAALWYTEVEGMPAGEAAHLLGISAIGASTLAARAGKALRSAWIAAHASRELPGESCRSTVERLQRYRRGRLAPWASREVAAHLDACDRCAKAAAEFSKLDGQLGLTLATVFLGSTGATALRGELGPRSSAMPAGGARESPSGSTISRAAGWAASSAELGARAGSLAMVGAVIGAAAVIGIAALVVSYFTAPVGTDEPAPAHTEQVQESTDDDPGGIDALCSSSISIDEPGATISSC